MFEPVILERFDGGAPLATTRISRYTAVFDRYCYDDHLVKPEVLQTHLSNELRPWLRVAGHNGLAGSPVQTGSATQLLPTPTIVFNARYCV